MSDIDGRNFVDRSERDSPVRAKSNSRSGSRNPSQASKRSESRSHSRRRYRHLCFRRKKSRSGSYTPDYRRRRSQSASPMSNRRRHAGSRTNPDPSTCLGVFGLSLYATERDLREVFFRYGPLSGVNVVYDQRSGRSRGFAFVHYEHIGDAKEAMEQVNGMELDGRRIRVDYSITKLAHTPTPGIYMGRPTHFVGGGGSSGGRRQDSYYNRGYDRYDRHDKYDYRYSRRRSPSPLLQSLQVSFKVSLLQSTTILKSPVFHQPGV